MGTPRSACPAGGGGTTDLGLFELLVVVCFQFDQRAEDVLVLVGVLIAQQHVLGLLVHTGLLQVLQGGAGVILGAQRVSSGLGPAGGLWVQSVGSLLKLAAALPWIFCLYWYLQIEYTALKNNN